MINLLVFVTTGHGLMKQPGVSLSGLKFTRVCVCRLHAVHEFDFASHKHLPAYRNPHKTWSCLTIAVNENAMIRSCMRVQRRCLLFIVPAVLQVYGGENMRYRGDRIPQPLYLDVWQQFSRTREWTLTICWVSPRSLDLTPPHFLLRGYLQDAVYGTKPATL
jgi:hypothetical protein